MVMASVAALLLLGGCAGSRDLHARPEASFREQLRQAIPVGTSIADAEALLTSRGYSCARPQGPGKADPVLSCLDQGAPVGSLVARIWHVQIVHDADGKVIDIDANISRAYAL